MHHKVTVVALQEGQLGGVGRGLDHLVHPLASAAAAASERPALHAPSPHGAHAHGQVALLLVHDRRPLVLLNVSVAVHLRCRSGGATAHATPHATERCPHPDDEVVAQRLGLAQRVGVAEMHLRQRVSATTHTRTRARHTSSQPRQQWGAPPSQVHAARHAAPAHAAPAVVAGWCRLPPARAIGGGRPASLAAAVHSNPRAAPHHVETAIDPDAHGLLGLHLHPSRAHTTD